MRALGAAPLPDDAAKIPELSERAVLDARGLMIRYGQLYGPGTYFETEQLPPPRMQVDEAARRTVEILDSPPGIVEVVDDELAYEPHATSTGE